MNEAREALVLVAYGGHGIVQPEQGKPVSCLFRRRVGRPCCGDHVMIRRADDDQWVVDEILARKNNFLRADAKGRPQIVAANLDRVAIVIASAPMPSKDLLDRYLTAVHSLQIEPVIVVNKTDLPVDTGHAGAATFAHLEHYRELGYAIAQTSCKDAPGVKELQPLVGGQTCILVGQSGVGKSSLVRQLLPDLDIQTGALSAVTGKGTHTTTTTILYDLPGGGRLIDSPGVWEYGLWRLEDRDIARGYPEILELEGQCRFNDCLHISEPGCEVKTAVAEGQIASWRYEAYARLLEQNKTQLRH